MLDNPPKSSPTLSWSYAGLWTLGIFAAIPLARSIQAWVAQMLGHEIFTYLVVSGILLGLWLSVRYVRRHKPEDSKNLWWLGLVAGAYLAYTMVLAAGHPVEAVHLLQYGILGLLVFRALAHRVRDYSIYASTAVICGMVGIADEVIQWITPDRYWDIRDIWMNFFAALMAQVALAFGLRPKFVNGPPGSANLRLFWGLLVAGLVLLAANLVFILPKAQV